MSPSPEYLSAHEKRLAEILEELQLEPDQAQQYRTAYLRAALDAYGTQDSMLSESLSSTSDDQV